MKIDKVFVIFAILLLALAFGFKIFLLFNSTIGFDEAGISYIAKEISAGKTLYLDYFDHKPPLMHYLLSVIYSYVEPTNFSIKLLALIFDSLLLLSIFFVSKKFLGIKYAFFAAAIYSIFNLSLSLNTEIIMSIFGLWALFFYISALQKEKMPNFNLFISGIFIAIAIWFKQSALFFYLPIVVHMIYLKHKKTIAGKELIDSFMLFTLGVLVVSVPLLSYFLYKIGFYFLYAIFTFNLQFQAASSRILQIGKGLNILFFYLGALIAISLSYLTINGKKSFSKNKENLIPLLLIFNILILIFIFISSEIFYQHFFQLIPFTILLAILSIKLSKKQNKDLPILMFIIIIISSLAISLSVVEQNIREIRSGSINDYQEVLDYLNEEVPKNKTFFADNPIYTLLGGYQLNQPIIGVAPSFSSAFSYSFICDLDYLILTHRKKYLSDDELVCILENYDLRKRFDNVGESFVEIWQSKES